MDQDSLSDERLVLLHQQKRVNAFFALYKRYRNYGYAIVFRTLENAKLINALKDERDAILYDSIIEAISCFDREKGTFRNLLSTIIMHQTTNYIRDFRKNPLSDYISIDAEYNEETNFRYADSLTFADKSETPQDRLNVVDDTYRIRNNYDGVHKRRIKKMVKLREKGFSYKEIAKQFNTSEKAVRSVFYRIKRRIMGKENNKIKK